MRWIYIGVGVAIVVIASSIVGLSIFRRPSPSTPAPSPTPCHITVVSWQASTGALVYEVNGQQDTIFVRPLDPPALIFINKPNEPKVGHVLASMKSPYWNTGFCAGDTLEIRTEAEKVSQITNQGPRLCGE